ncbi:MAG: DUF3524 domain-containing protein [Rubripirellula sp.]|nr:DUF3524 domain-containing protein [Rubripirellula sp.]
MFDSPLHALAIDPYCGGSHQAFLDNIGLISRHDWHFIRGDARFWKWRMRSYPLSLVEEQLTSFRDASCRAKEVQLRIPHGMMVTSMLDLPAYRGLLASKANDVQLTPEERDHCQLLLRVPTAIYFHENQITYPISPHAKEDSHYGYTNILSAMVADEIWFNSEFHRTDFLTAARGFIRRMPDQRQAHPLECLEQKSYVIYPGFRPQSMVHPEKDQRQQPLRENRSSKNPICIGWVARWEYDKRPDQFLELLRIVSKQNIDFELVLLGDRAKSCETLSTIEKEFQKQVRYTGHANSTHQYHHYLNSLDVVVSTADHEYFGIAMCEAISAGAVPVLPARLSYPELAEPDFLYTTLNEAADLITRLTDTERRSRASVQCRSRIQHLTVENCVEKIDKRFEKMVDSRTKFKR